MKIAVIGPQNTGKTTFIKDFLENFKNYKTTKISYRDIVKKHKLPINQETSEKSQKIIMNFLYDAITKNKVENIIFDRCLIDNYVYSYCAFEKKIISKNHIHITKRKMFDHLSFLDCIIFIPTAASVKLENDKLRDTDTNFIDRVNRVFMEILFEISNKTNIPIFIVTGSREERIKQVKEKIM